MVDETHINPERHRSARGYRTSTDLVTRSGGIFWGIVLLIVGIIWLLGTLGYFELNVNVLLPMLIIILGLWLLVTKSMR
jgi:apolipoprotein N-acyltransferase